MHRPQSMLQPSLLAACFKSVPLFTTNFPECISIQSETNCKSETFVVCNKSFRNSGKQVQYKACKSHDECPQRSGMNQGKSGRNTLSLVPACCEPISQISIRSEQSVLGLYCHCLISQIQIEQIVRSHVKKVKYFSFLTISQISQSQSARDEKTISQISLRLIGIFTPFEIRIIPGVLCFCVAQHQQ